MHSTQASLLDRVRTPADGDAWVRFVGLYTPLLYAWARRLGLDEHEGGDLVQDVFAALIERLPGFTYEPGRRFRGWLWTLMLNRFRERRRAAAVRGAADGRRAGCDEGPDTVAEFAEAEYRSYLYGRALQLMQADFEPASCRAFCEHVLNHRPAAEVAAELGLTVGAVYAAKARILGRLREELRGLVD